MNITTLRLRESTHQLSLTPAIVQFARKLETAATGRFPLFPKHIFLSQAHGLATNLELARSAAASLTEVHSQNVGEIA